MVTDFVESCYVGQTIRVTAKDLTDIDDGPITVGANVVIERYDPDGTLGDTGAISNNGADWFANFLIPDDPGTHVIRLQASNLGKTWRGKGFVIVRPF